MSGTNPNPGKPEPREQRGHASEGVFTRGVWLAIAGLLIIIVLSVAITAAMMAWLQDERPVPSPTREAQIQMRQPPGPPGPFDELADLRRSLETEQLNRLRSSGWINRQQNLAHVPIDHATQHILENGLPDFQNPNSAAEPADDGQQGVNP